LLGSWLACHLPRKLRVSDCFQKQSPQVDPKSIAKVKSSPFDIEQFRNETSIKYPTFTPSPQPPPSLVDTPVSKVSKPAQLTSRLAKAYSPIPVRHHYHHEEIEPAQGGHPQGQLTQFPTQHQNQSSFRPHTVQPATPAPSPPPSPKPKKQQYQTDQNRPFLFPFSKNQFGRNNRLIPFAIDEAEGLYNKHLYVSLSLAQMWKTREDCMTAESGLDHLPGVEEHFRSSTYIAEVMSIFLCAESCVADDNID
jgi:hypothetical protein